MEEGVSKGGSAEISLPRDKAHTHHFASTGRRSALCSGEEGRRDRVSTVLSTYAHAIRQDDSRCAEVFEDKMINL